MVFGESWIYLISMCLLFRLAEILFSGVCHSFGNSDLSGFRTPLWLVKNAFAEPKFKYISNRTGRWLASSVT